MSTSVEMRCIHNVAVIERIVRRILHILAPCSGSYDNNTTRSNGTDNRNDFLCIRLNFIVPRSGRSIGLIADFINHVRIILIQGGHFTKKSLRLLFVDVRVLFTQHMPVDDYIDAKINSVLYSLFHFIFLGRVVDISAILRIHRSTKHGHSPIVS
ncbi:hypothetical protein D3C76_990670 [compost metagenome]